MSPLEARTVPAGQAPASNGGRHGRPFTLRVERDQEDTLRREMARLELLPYDKRPADLFGWDAGGGGGRRRQSFGWFLLWAALQWARHHDGEGGLRVRAIAPGKTKRRRPAKRAGRKPAKRAKKGGRR
jgi:hypothetical protein